MSPLYSFLDTIRNGVKSFMRKIAYGLNKIFRGRLSPNTITIVGFLAHIPIVFLIAKQDFVIAGVLLIIFGLFDTLDGELARLQKTDSPKGMLLDSVTDRMKEAMLYIGISYAFIQMNKPYYAVWAVAACGAALIVSYINAWGEVVTADLPKEKHSKNKTFRISLMTFDVRITLLIIGLLFNQLSIIVIIIAILSSFTALERLSNISKRL